MDISDPILASKITNLLGATILTTTFLVVGYRRLRACVGAYGLHSFLLACVAAEVGFFTGFVHLYIAALLTIVIKVIIIPRVLNRIIERINVKREVDLYVNVPSSLLISGGLAILAYFVTQPIAGLGSLITRNCLAVSIAVMLIGLFIMITRVQALSQIIGLLTLENGLFLGAIATTYGMPLIVEIGVFFDVLVGVLILVVFMNRINQKFITLDTKRMRQLRG
ncbi:MAG TPA: hydrogenase [Nitrospiria bacterium]|jgi:hydrogenase-4 component E